MMLLVISKNTKFTASYNEDDSFKLVVKRIKEVRQNWLIYYDSGSRLFRLSHGDRCNYALLKRRPQVDGASIAFEIELFKIAEVWGGMDGELCSVFFRVGGTTYQARSINGWKFAPYNEVNVAFPNCTPSAPASQLALNFLKENYDSLTNKNNERQSSNTTISPGPKAGTNDSGGATEAPGLFLPL